MINYEGHQLKNALESLGNKLDLVFDMTIEEQKQSLTDMINKSISKLISHERLINIYGSDYLLDLIKPKLKIAVEKSKSQKMAKIDDEKFESPDLNVDMSKIELMTDANEHFIDELNKHLSKRVDNLRERKYQLETKAKEESEKQELSKNQQERRRGGWKDPRKPEQKTDDHGASMVLANKIVDLTNVTNYSADIFKFFDKSKVVRNIDDIRGDEDCEYVIPEEQLFGRLYVTR